MGLIYLRRRAYEQAEACFQDLLELDDRTIYLHWPSVGSKYGRSETYRTVAQFYLALAWAERGVNLRRAALRIDTAREILGDGSWIQDRDRVDYEECWALHDLCHGWVQFRRAQLGLATEPAHKTALLDGAIADLELAVSRVASANLYADAYLRLARVCDERARLDPADKVIWVARAKEAAQHCQVADLRREYTAEIDKLLAPPAQPQAKPDVLVEVGRRR
jgi:tetratricopeptide (TPR) repeat protein